MRAACLIWLTESATSKGRETHLFAGKQALSSLKYCQTEPRFGGFMLKGFEALLIE